MLPEIIFLDCYIIAMCFLFLTSTDVFSNNSEWCLTKSLNWNILRRTAPCWTHFSSLFFLCYILFFCVSEKSIRCWQNCLATLSHLLSLLIYFIVHGSHILQHPSAPFPSITPRQSTGHYPWPLPVVHHQSASDRMGLTSDPLSRHLNQLLMVPVIVKEERA